MNIDLAYARNQLLNNSCNTELRDNLLYTQKKLVSKNNPFFNICNQCLENAIDDIDCKDYVSAGYQINFIHNMPMNPEDFNKWDEEHFFEFEVPTFFDNTDGVDRIKKMILLLAELVQARDI